MIDWRWLHAIPGFLAQGPVNAALFYPRFTRVHEHALGPGITMLEGGGSNVTALVAGTRALLVDAKFPPQDGRVAKFARDQGIHVETLINTHHHYDHTHGNPRFAGARVVAHRRAVERLDQFDRAFWREPDAKRTKPEPLDGDRTRLEFAGEAIDLIHLPGHTDGDIVVHLVDRGVICAGDLLFHGHYPFVDRPAGGSFRAWQASLGEVLALDGDIVVPGHGETATRADVERFRQYLEELTTAVAEARRSGWTLAEMQDRIKLRTSRGFRPIPSFSLVPDANDHRLQWASRRQNIRWAWEELIEQESRAELSPGQSGQRTP